jgi:hypothetical protein
MWDSSSILLAHKFIHSLPLVDLVQMLLEYLGRPWNSYFGEEKFVNKNSSSFCVSQRQRYPHVPYTLQTQKPVLTYLSHPQSNPCGFLEAIVRPHALLSAYSQRGQNAEKYAAKRDGSLESDCGVSKRYTISSRREIPTSWKIVPRAHLSIVFHHHLLLLQSTQGYSPWPMSVQEQWRRWAGVMKYPQYLT